MIAHASAPTHALLALGGVAAVAAYTAGWWKHPGSSPWPLAAWVTAVLTVVAALSPPFEALADRTYTGHMLQHLALVLVAAPLMAMARPLVVWFRSRPRHHLPPAATRTAIRVTAPMVAAAVFVGVLAVTHLTPIYDYAIRHRYIHDLEHAAYLSAAIGLWAALLGGRRHDAGRRLAAVFAVTAGMGLVSMVLVAAEHPMVESYVDRLGDAKALTDQRSAAALMWISGMAVTLPLIVLIVWRWASAEQRATLRREELQESVRR